MSACCCIHIGLRKTGGTTLQRHLFRGHSQVDYLGLWREKYRDDFVERLACLVGGRSLDGAALQEARGLLREHVLPALDAGHTPVWSLQALSLGRPAERRAKARNIRRVFGPCRVLVVIREPVALIESVYLQALREMQIRPRSHGYDPGRYFAVEDFLARWGEDHLDEQPDLDYARTIRLHADQLGADRVGAFLYEQLREAPQAFVRAVCEFMGIDADEGERLVVECHENPRLSVAQVEFIRALESELARRRSFVEADPEARTEILAELAGGPAARAPVPPAWRRRIEDVTREGNRYLMREWGVPLDRHGYPL